MNSINERINELALKYFEGNNSNMAAALSTSEANIRNYRSKREPRIDMLNKIVEVLGITYEWLLTGKEETPPEETSIYKKHIALQDAHKDLFKENLKLMRQLNNLLSEKYEWLLIGKGGICTRNIYNKKDNEMKKFSVNHLIKEESDLVRFDVKKALALLLEVPEEKVFPVDGTKDIEVLLTVRVRYLRDATGTKFWKK